MHVILCADTNKAGELSLRELQAAFKKPGRKLIQPPTASEMRRLPGLAGRNRPFGGPQPPPDRHPGQEGL